MTIAQLRESVRRLLGLDPRPPAGSRAEWDARRRARLERDAREWAKQEARDREDREFERALESERLKMRLERGPLFPNDW